MYLHGSILIGLLILLGLTAVVVVWAFRDTSRRHQAQVSGLRYDLRVQREGYEKRLHAYGRDMHGMERESTPGMTVTDRRAADQQILDTATASYEARP
jgi:hypothetical protein